METANSLPVVFARLDSAAYDAVLVHRALAPHWPSGATAALRFGAGRQSVGMVALVGGCTGEEGRPCDPGPLRVHVLVRWSDCQGKSEAVVETVRAAVRELRDGRRLTEEAETAACR